MILHNKVSPPVILISERFGYNSGGEAIKAQQYFNFLLENGFDVRVITAERSKVSHGAEVPDERLWLIKDSIFQKILWWVPPLRPFLGVHFQWRARQMVLRNAGDGAKPSLHNISPVSPVALRFPIKGYRNILGPLTGNIYYPKGFRRRMSVGNRFREALHNSAQVLFGRVLGDKENVDVFLVSGYERTRASLLTAGCSESKMIDVVDSGVSDKLNGLPRITHKGINAKFMCSGRLVDHKGIDLAIRAVAEADPSVTLAIYGDGEERPKLEALVEGLGLGERVTFHGWLKDHDDLIARYSAYRGYILPSLAEANGIVMQEAMMAGLPVVALRWGGPAMLADDTSAIYVTPTAQQQVVTEIAQAMTKLAKDGAYAETLSANAYAIALPKFTWTAVANSWLASYGSEKTTESLHKDFR